MLQYTICFIKQADQILMLNRVASPTKGLWNGIGGKIEQNETPEACIIREAFEETGIKLESVNYKGVVLWNVDGVETGGMYLFLAELPNDYTYPTPLKVEEGILDWRLVDWILSENNFGVGELIPHYLPIMLDGEECLEHRFTFERERLTNYSAAPLAAGVY